MLKHIIQAIKNRRPFTVYGDNGKVYHFKTITAAYNFTHH